MRLKLKSDGGMARSNSSVVLTNLLKTTTSERKGGRIAHTTSEYAKVESPAISKHRVASHYLIQAEGTLLNPEDQKRTKSGRKADGNEGSAARGFRKGARCRRTMQGRLPRCKDSITNSQLTHRT